MDQQSIVRELVLKNRSRRRFYQGEEITNQTLENLVDLARLSPSGANAQPLKYMLFNQVVQNELVYNHLGWAGYLEDWSGPEEGEKPSAYILILGDKRIKKSFGCDHGIAAQTIMLGATELGYGGCIMASIRREGLRKLFDIEEHFMILLALALGKPKEDVILEELAPQGDYKYWRTPDGVHHVPKRSLDEIILR